MILITGCSRGIGKFLADTFHKNNEKVIGISRSKINNEYETFQANVSDFEQLAKIAEELRSRKEKIDLLINAAGILLPSPVILSRPENTREIIETNFLGTVYSCQVFSPLMLGNQDSNIVNFSSIATKLNLQGEAIYTSSKMAVEVFTNIFAKEVSKFNLRVNCVAPGPINTEMISHLSDKDKNNLIDSQIIKKQFDFDSVFKLIHTIVSDNSKSLTGQTFYLGGV